MSAPLDINIEVSQRLPLADATLRLLDYATEDAFLDDVFERHRGRCFERALSFPLFVHLMADALIGHRGSAHQAFCHAQEVGALATSVQAMYNRLATLPGDVSMGFFAEAVARLNAVVMCPAIDTLPVSLGAYRAVAMDGKKLKYVAKRLKLLRGLKGNIFGGKLVVAQDMATGQALAVEAALDGEAADNPLVPGAVARVRALPDSRPRLWVDDRGFCDFKTLHLLSEGDDGFLVRYHPKCKFHLDPAIPARTGIDDVGREYREEWGWLGAPNNKNRIRVRMITVTRPTGGPFMLVTSLMDADRHPAYDLLVLYRRRWGIETMFQRVVQTFDLRHLIGATPEATIFQAVFCLLLYNIMLTIRDYVAAGADRAPETVSPHLLHADIVEELTAWMKVIGPDATVDVLKSKTFNGPADFQRYLQRTLGGVWTDRWAKAKTTKRPPKKPPRAYLKGGHSSVDRILRGAHKEIPIKPHKLT
jgi:Transposase DDE domain